MNKYKKLFNNSIIFAIGNFGSSIITFLMVPLYTYQLTTSEYGTVDLFSTTVSLFLPVASLSIYEAVLRFIMEKDANHKKVYSNGLYITNISAIFLALISVVLAFLKSLYIFIPLLLILQLYQTLFSQYAKGTGKVKIFALDGIVLSFLTAGLNLLFLVPLKMGLNGYLISLILAFSGSVIFMYIVLKLYKEFDKQTLDRKYQMELIKFSIPLIPNAIAWWLTTTVGRYFILFFVGTSGNGFYAVANKIPTLLTVIMNIFSQSWRISAIEEYDSDSRGNFFSNVYQIYSELLIVISSGILIFIQIIFKLLIGEAFYSAWKFVPLLLISVIFSSLSDFLGTQYIAAKQTGGILKTTIAGAVLNVLLNLLLVPLLGVNGVGLASIISFATVWLIRDFDLKKYFSFTMGKQKFTIGVVVLFVQYALFMFLNGPILYIGQIFSFLFVTFLNRKLLLKIISNTFDALFSKLKK